MRIVGVVRSIKCEMLSCDTSRMQKGEVAARIMKSILSPSDFSIKSILFLKNIKIVPHANFCLGKRWGSCLFNKVVRF